MLTCSNLLCEAMRSPLGIDIAHPRLTWMIESDQPNIMQVAFQVIVSKTMDEVQAGKGSFYDSSRQESSNAVCIIPKPVRDSATRYYWSVRAWDNHGAISGWSEPQWFETGLLFRKDWVAKWIEPKQRPVFKEGMKLGDVTGGFPNPGSFAPNPQGNVPGNLPSPLPGNLPSPLDGMPLPQEMASLPSGNPPILPPNFPSPEGDLPVPPAGMPALPSTMPDPMTLLASLKAKPVDESAMNACPIIRKEFSVLKKVKRARAYATAHGLYRLEINGRRVGNLEFMPEATPYQQYLQYQTYDVTELLAIGNNAVGVTLSDGWWAGRIGLTGESCTYGDKLALLLQINIEYEDGSFDRIGSDGSFTSFEGPIRFADLFMGEKYDARFERKGWSLPGYPRGAWQNVLECDYDLSGLVGQNAEPIRILRTMKPVQIYTSPKGETIVDFGQCLAGNARFVLNGLDRRGQQVVFSYTQQTDKDGNYDNQILMPFNKQHQDYYIFKGEAEEVYDPAFTYRGFRFVRVEGYDGEFDLDKIEARLIASDVEYIGDFKCSNPDVTQLQKNIQWTLISNLMSIPTDNPDRERAGWTGDHEMIAATMYYNLRMQAFIRRWMTEHRLEQKPDGGIPHFVPFWSNPSGVELNATAGWGDNCIITPWIFYQEYGDIRILEENYAMMTRWMDYVLHHAALNPPPDGDITPERLENYKYIWNGEHQHGDWMTPSENYGPNGRWRYMSASILDFAPCFYMAYSADLMVKIATLLGKTEDAAYYNDLGNKIRKAVIAEFFDTGYILNTQFQGVPVLSLKARLVPEEKRAAVAERLVELIQKDGGKVNTGFTSNEHILGVLCEAGRADLAYDLLLQEEMPSWLYMAKKGTTLWESWQAIMPDGTVNIASLIQYALANMGKWMYTAIAGIEAAAPGYKKVRIGPVFDPKLRITSAAGSLMSPQGKISTRWEIAGKHVCLEVVIPPNSTAEIVLRGAAPGEQALMNRAALDSTQRKPSASETEYITEIGSGSYTFEYELA